MLSLRRNNPQALVIKYTRNKERKHNNRDSLFSPLIVMSLSEMENTKEKARLRGNEWKRQKNL